MFGEGSTYFQNVLDPKGHFIILGRTNDLYVSDALEQQDIREHLHHHLRQHGYDAVLFCDANNMMYCYDEQSCQIMFQGQYTAPRAHDAERDASIPGGRGRSRIARRSTVQQTQSTSGRTRYNLGQTPIERVWQRMSVLLQNPDYSIAVVFNTVDALHGSLTNTASFQNMIHALECLSSVQPSNANKPQSSAFYIFRENSLCRVLENNASGGISPEWRTLFETVLRPRIETGDRPEDNRVINLTTPNAAEIRNLLNLMRLREQDPLRIEVSDLEELSMEFANSCARKKYGLSDLRLSLEIFAQAHPDTVITLADWKQIMHETNYRSADERLQEMVGMDRVKENISNLRLRCQDRVRAEMPQFSSRFTPIAYHESVRNHSLNVIFKGPAGTGKTSVARLLAQLYYDMGLLPIAKTTEVNASTIVSQNVGGTPQLVREWIQQALGGVLFIDEAYMLAGDAHGRQAIDQIVADLSAFQGQLAVVLAGYPDQMDELIAQNPGLPRRFPNVYEFEDYTPAQMQQILEYLVRRDSDQVEFAPDMQTALPHFCENWVKYNGLNWGNGGEAENLLTAMKSNYHQRIASEETPFDGIYHLSVADLPEEFREYAKPAAANMKELEAKLDTMIGLQNVREYLRSLGDRIALQSGKVYPGNYIFSGPPGTGKTTTVYHMCEMLFLLKVIKRRKPVVRTAGELMKHDYIKNLTPRDNLRNAVAEARGTILFIDEAHQLIQNADGREVISELVPLIENPEIRADTGFILAGYSKEMNDFINFDPGMKRRFPENCRLRFENYTAQELVQILREMLFAQNEVPEERYLERSTIALEKFLQQPHPNFGNGGYIRDVYIPNSKNARVKRLKQRYGNGAGILSKEAADAIPEQEKRTLTAADLPPEMLRYAGPPDAELPEHRSAETLLQELLNKSEIAEYINSRRTMDGESVFMDDSSDGRLFFAISGPAGSGRRTAAEAMAKMWKELGLLPRDDTRIVDKGSLEAGFVGQTAGKTQEQIEQALDGTLVVMNPSSMLPKSSTDNTFGPEALGTLAGAMAVYGDRLSVIFIDTEEGMEAFLHSFTNIKGMLTREFHLEDLRPEDMHQLFCMKTRDHMCFEESLQPLLPDFFLNWVSDRGGLGDQLSAWGNGMEIEQLVSALKTAWVNQNGTVCRENHLPKRLITAKMFPKQMQKYLRPAMDLSRDAMVQLEELTGLARVKQSIHHVRRRLRYMSPDHMTPGLYCYIGNPGVGKTTVAKLMGGVLRAAGALRHGHVVVRTARQVSARPSDFEKLVKLARHGILFIDEAHQLADSGYGIDVIKRLLTVIEDPEVMKDTCIILAGYPAEMLHMLEQDSGLQSRFGSEDSMIVFDDYTPEELLRILEVMTAGAHTYPQIGSSYPMRMTAEYRSASLEIFRAVRAQNDSKFGNARFVRNYVRDCVTNLLERLEQEHPDAVLSADEHNLLECADIPSRYSRFIEQKTAAEFIPIQNISTALHPSIDGTDLDAFCAEQAKAVVLLEMYREGRRAGSGTGFIVSPQGHVLTCCHVAQDCDRIRARLRIPGMPGGDCRWFECRILPQMYQDCDMALLRMEGDHFPYVPIRPMEAAVSESERTLMIGYPLGTKLGSADTLAPSTFTGRVASLQEIADGNASNIQRYMLNSTGLHGNSGSPVFSMEDGRVIGVFSGSVVGTKNSLDELNYFYPISYFWQRFVQ